MNPNDTLRGGERRGGKESCVRTEKGRTGKVRRVVRGGVGGKLGKKINRREGQGK